MQDNKTEKMICDLKELITNAINLFMEKFEIVQNEIQNINKRLDEHEEQQRKDFEQVNQRLDKIEARFDEHEKQQRKDFEKVYEKFNQIEARFDEHEDKQRNDLVLLEHNLFERTGALFDAWKIDEDRAKEIKIKFSSIDNILENYHYRIAALESKQN